MQCGCVLVFESQTPWSCCSLSWSAWELRDFECFEISFLPVHVYLEQADILQWTLYISVLPINFQTLPMNNMLVAVS